MSLFPKKWSIPLFNI